MLTYFILFVNLFLNTLILFTQRSAFSKCADNNRLSVTGNKIKYLKKLLLADFKTVI